MKETGGIYARMKQKDTPRICHAVEARVRMQVEGRQPMVGCICSQHTTFGGYCTNEKSYEDEKGKRAGWNGGPGRRRQGSA
jgi:hypothetical protein